ncbi:DICT sensory domain-containing protein [Haloarcula salinisoli]|uniref:Histidine kinase n=1 Tax=Haloarcula salinisoli TaxID=2487746 RepID=A0A8J8CBS5_9EURY|nr:DICT sensory domain-containing protein [Halomicroarcula salinisoli]MBX0285812.1 histidine kinase [Halomicroarcula salinisoli]MBX0302695.1 histidine kinase [Halomicroarcula salinisoli]
MSSAVEQLRALVGETAAPEQSLVVVNRTEGDPIQRLLATTFDGQSVDIRESDVPDAEDDTVVLVRDGAVVATSSLQSVMDACLLVNSDLYRTGPGGIEKSRAPSVITELDETVFKLRGFPASVKEKLILILISRYIETLALDHGAGVLRATFQELSRLGTENGTREVYRRLSETDLSVHVYGVNDWELSPDLDIVAHTGSHRGYRDSWCVVFRPPDDRDRHAALLALETGPNEWVGTWTYDAQKVRRVDEILVDEF